MVEPSLSRESAAPTAHAATWLRRRTLLDLSIDDEIVRGDLRGNSLDAPLRTALAVVVEHQLAHEEPLAEDDLVDRLRPRRLFGASVCRRRIDALAELNLVRRDGHSVYPTVAGVAAVLLPSSLEGPRLPRDLLRSLRRAELASFHS
ncbi:MAG: hypothetical protein QM630_08380 [Microbacterium sp.]